LIKADETKQMKSWGETGSGKMGAFKPKKTDFVNNGYHLNKQI
jgi:hypothetical protein